MVGLLLVGLISAQIIYDKEMWRRVNYLENRDLSSMIIDSIKNLEKPAVVDGASSKVYLPEPHLVLPPYPTNVQGIRYNYDQQDERLQITTDLSLGTGIAGIRTANTLEDIFKQVPKAQACGRQTVLTFKDIYDQESDYLSKAGTKQLANGKTLYIYVDKNCTENSQQLVSYLQQAQSY